MENIFNFPLLFLNATECSEDWAEKFFPFRKVIGTEKYSNPMNEKRKNFCSKFKPLSE